MNLYRARIGSIAAVALCCATPLSVKAEPQANGPSLWFQGSRLILPTGRAGEGDIVVASTDSGLAHFLARLGARISYQSGQRYVVVTTADRREISFTVDENEFHIEGQTQSAPFAISAHDGAAYLPFFTLARALDVAAVTQPGEVILEPQITALDAHEDHGRTIIMVHAAIALHPEVVAQTPGRVSLRFRGVGSSLDPRSLGAGPGVSSIVLNQGGTPRNPETLLTVAVGSQVRAGFLRSPDPHGTVLALAGKGVALNAALIAGSQTATTATTGAAPESGLADGNAADAGLADVYPAPSPAAYRPAALVTPAPLPVVLVTPAPLPAQAGPAQITAVDEHPGTANFDVHLTLNPQAAYRWHMLGDGRFYVDFPGSRLLAPQRDESLNDTRVSSLRIRDNGTATAPNVRLAMNLVGGQAVRITNDRTGLNISIGGGPAVVAGQSGFGRVGQSGQTDLAKAPLPVLPGLPARPVFSGGGSRLIVLDPGHGGSDSGALGNGLVEKDLTLDIARRLRTVLIARGWQVMMTRDSDVDVYAPNDSAREELQARCDVANRAGARLFVSIHINSFTSPDMQGTTTYYYKPGDEHFADVVDQRLIATLGTQDDGARRENYYVIRHTTMPAILVETAFLSNSSDANRLRQPSFRQNVAQAIGEGITTYTAQAPAPAAPSQIEEAAPASRPAPAGAYTPRTAADPPADDLTP